MAISPSASIAQAAQAYTRALQSGEVGSATDVAQPPSGTPFSQLVRNSVEGAVATAKNAEQMTIAAVEGKADISQVVTAVAEAELTLQTVVTVRDKVIDAYKEILRMPI